jgi:hypothetical protein
MPFGRVRARGLLHAARMAAGPDGIREPVLNQLRPLWTPSPVMKISDPWDESNQRQLFQRRHVFRDTPLLL